MTELNSNDDVLSNAPVSLDNTIKSSKKPHGLTGRKRPPEVCEKISKAHKGKPKNYPSYLKGRTGPNHPSYKHGKGATRVYDHEKHAAWKQGVLRASNFRCFITNQDHHLECHHLIGWWYEPTRYTIENGIAISADIHKDFHDNYGRGDNTPEQFEKFCEEKYNVTNFPWRQGDHKPSFTIEEEQSKIVSLSANREDAFKLTVKNRGHEIVSGVYVNNNSTIVLRCTTHDHSQEVRAGNYKKSKFGLCCCSKEGQCKPRKKVEEQSSEIN